MTTERKYVIKQDKLDMRDRVFLASNDPIPDSVDLRSHMSSIVNQGQLGSCTANAIASGLGEYLQLSKGQSYVPLSRLDLYWQERNLEGTINEDSGAYIRDGMKVFQQRGIAPETDFPYDITKFTQQPSAQADADAAQHKITEYHRVLTFADMQAALAQGCPVVIGISVYSSFESYDVSVSGMIPVPDKTKEQLLGGHAVLVVGYKKMNDGKTYAIVRNSWGTNWGQEGYCMIPEDFWNAGFVSDMWMTVDGMTNPPASLTFNQAIDIIAAKGIIDSPDFWKNLGAKYDNATGDFRYVQLAFIKMATYLNK